MKRKSPFTMRFSILLIIFAVITTVIASLVIAYFVRNTDKVENKFEPASSFNPDVRETFDKNAGVKENVDFWVNNTGYPVYVRAAIVITWQKKEADGTYTVYYRNPIEGEGNDYKLDLNLSETDTGWKKGENDAYYYFQTPVESGRYTSVLMNRCEQLATATPPDGYTLSVEILVQTVQAIGDTDEDNPNGVIPAYQDAWNLS